MWERGDVKITLGTGTFVNVHTGKVPYASMSGGCASLFDLLDLLPIFCDSLPTGVVSQMLGPCFDLSHRVDHPNVIYVDNSILRLNFIQFLWFVQGYILWSAGELTERLIISPRGMRMTQRSSSTGHSLSGFSMMSRTLPTLPNRSRVQTEQSSYQRSAGSKHRLTMRQHALDSWRWDQTLLKLTCTWLERATIEWFFNSRVRAILESIAFRVYQIYKAADSEVYINQNSPVRICGGVSNNDFICQCISDLLGRNVERMTNSDHVAARGVALLAGYSQGLWNKQQMKKLVTVSHVFTPNEKSRSVLMKSFETWKKAVNRCLGFYE